MSSCNNSVRPPKISADWVGCTNVTDDRQTDRQTTDDKLSGDSIYSEREQTTNLTPNASVWRLTCIWSTRMIYITKAVISVSWISIYAKHLLITTRSVLPHQRDRIIKSITPLPSWFLCCLWHHRPQHLASHLDSVFMALFLAGSILTCHLAPFAPFPDCLHGLLPAPFLLSYSVFYFYFFHYFSFLGRALD